MHQTALDSSELRVFLCYRRADGAWHAKTIYQALVGSTVPDDTQDRPRRIHVYYDQEAPGVADWTKLHFPSLQSAHALVLVCTPGIAVDLSNRGSPDWLHKELRWWVQNRTAAPIVVDATGEGPRWLPELVTRRWPNLNRIDLVRSSDWSARDIEEVTNRLRNRVTGAIRESERATVFDEQQKRRRLRRLAATGLSAAIVCAALAAVALYGFREAQAARRLLSATEQAARARGLLMEPGAEHTALRLALSACLAAEAEKSPPSSYMISTLHAATEVAGASVPLRGHLGSVTAVEFSADGRQIVTSGADNSARVWDAAQMNCKAVLRGSHIGKVLCATFAPDGQHVATASEDGTVCVWDSLTESVAMQLRAHTKRVSTVQFSRDGQRIVTASDDNTARVWNAQKGTLEVTIKENFAWPAATFSPDGRWVLTPGLGAAHIWSAKDGELITTLGPHSSWVYAAHFSPDGTRIVTASGDNRACVWNTQGDLIACFEDPQGHAMHHAALSHDGKKVLSSCGSEVYLWNAEDGGLLGSTARHDRSVSCLRFSPDGKTFVTGSNDETAIVWSAFTSSHLRTLEGHRGKINAVQYSPDGSRIATASEDGTARIWGPKTGCIVTELDGKWVLPRACSPDSNLLIVQPHGRYREVVDFTNGLKLDNVSIENEVYWSAIYDLEARQYSAKLVGHDGIITSTQFSKDGMRVLTSSNDGTARVWNAVDGISIATLRGHNGPVRCAEFSSDCERIVTASSDHTARVWNARNGELVATCVAHQGPVRVARFVPGGQHVVSVGDDQLACIWNALDGRTIALMEEWHSNAKWIEFSPDGALVALSDGAAAGGVWSTLTGDAVQLTESDEGAGCCIRFAPDSSRFVTVNCYDDPRVWNARDGKLLATLEGSHSQVASVAYSADSKRIAIAGIDGSILVWTAEGGRPWIKIRTEHGVKSVQWTDDGNHIVALTDGSTVVYSLRAADLVRRAGELLYYQPEWGELGPAEQGIVGEALRRSNR
jgi:WD40 repeat protein